jgi:hypothetical protein
MAATDTDSTAIAETAESTEAALEDVAAIACVSGEAAMGSSLSVAA